MIRCGWVGVNKPYYEVYHDTEWGVPVHDDLRHFEMLILEGAQAGLSWDTILKRRTAYRDAFKQFDVHAVAQMSNEELEELLSSSHIIRNRLKVFSARKNAQVFIVIPEFDQNACFDLLLFVEVLPKIFRNRASYSSRFLKAPRQKSNC